MLVVTSVDKCDGLRIASDSTLHRGFGTVTFGATGMDRQPEAAGVTSWRHVGIVAAVARIREFIGG